MEAMVTLPTTAASLGSMTGQQPPEPLPLPDDAERGLIFFSHSSRRRTVEELSAGDSVQQHEHRKKFLNHLMTDLQTALQNQRFDVWWDHANLHGGDQFEAMIYDALNLCDAALVLVDRDGLTSEYMRREVTILMFRASVEGIPVIPVLLGGVTGQQLAKSALGKVGLNSRTGFSPDAKKWNAKDVPAVVDQITAEVEARFVPSLREVDPVTRRWIEDMTWTIRDIPPDYLWRAAQQLEETREAWRRNRRQVSALAASLLSSDNPEQIHAAMAEITGLLAPHEAERATKLARPLWVDLNAARVLTFITKLPFNHRVVGVSTRAFRLGEDFCRRTTASTPLSPICEIPDVTGESTLQEAVARYDETIRAKLNIFLGDGSAAVTHDLRRYRRVYALLRRDTWDVATTTAVVDILQGRFPGITFVLLGEPTSTQRIKIPMENHVEIFDRVSERDARRFVSDIAGLVGKSIPVDSDE